MVGCDYRGIQVCVRAESGEGLVAPRLAPNRASRRLEFGVMLRATMVFETEDQKREIQRWSRLAIQLNGAADSGHFDHITTVVMLRELSKGSVFDFLARELPARVWEISTLTDVDRHKLSDHWRKLAAAYEPTQFHVSRSGLALLVA